MRPTREFFKVQTDKWIGLLKLRHWEITVVWPEDYDKFSNTRDHVWDGDQHMACTTRRKDFNVAEILFNESAQFKDHREAEATVVHELLHLVTRDMEFILDQIEGMLHRDVDKIITEGHKHAVENAVEHLAYCLVDIFHEPGLVTGQ